jgi:hypothetical protein
LSNILCLTDFRHNFFPEWGEAAQLFRVAQHYSFTSNVKGISDGITPNEAKLFTG